MENGDDQSKTVTQACEGKLNQNVSVTHWATPGVRTGVTGRTSALTPCIAAKTAISVQGAAGAGLLLVKASSCIVIVTPEMR
ncbi:hypothetical protein RRG08_002501 [Elysia crispata]|uniref:Uncharacterized protein n=1 Tax=Elysia crispata TaxID=231223 RepID=A0AAE1A912_9GAST|nr:hypothetical protein RRG08_002501 [Elysia crispata]